MPELAYDDLDTPTDADVTDLYQQDVDEEPEESPLIKFLDQGNLVDTLTDSENTDYASKTLELLGEAEQSMDKWKKKYKRAMMLARLQPSSDGKEIEQKHFPFKGASLAMMPYITEAMLDFSSRAAPELVWAKDIVKAKIYGEKTPEKEARTERVANFQNYQLAEMIPSWRKNQDKGIFVLACPGTYYKETYYDSTISEVRSELRFADDIIFDHGYPTFEEAPDKFKKLKYTRNEVLGFIRGESQWKIEEKDLEKDEDEFHFTEAYTWYDLDDDGLKEPYISIIDSRSSKIVYLVPFYDEEGAEQNDKGEIVKVEALDRFTQYQFLPDPEGGPMGMGWGILLGPMFEAINTNVRQLIDAGTVANVSANSGFYAAGLTSAQGNAIQSGPIEAKLAQLTPIQTRGGRLRDSIVQFPAAGPNQTLMALMEYQVEAARRMTSATSNAESQAGEAASLYLARLQQSLKNPNSIIMRVYESAKAEQKKIGALNFKHYSDKKYNRVIDSEQQASMKADYDPEDCDIRLECDPTHGSDIERAARSQAILQEAKEQPSQILNLRQAYIDWLKDMKTPNIEELAPEPDPNQKDPQQELMLAQMGMEAELKKKDQELREKGQALQEKKMALEAIKAMKEQGLKEGDQQLKADELEAKITLSYTQSLKNIVEMGLAEDQQGLALLQNIEQTFIGSSADGGQPKQFNFNPATGEFAENAAG